MPYFAKHRKTGARISISRRTAAHIIQRAFRKRRRKAGRYKGLPYKQRPGASGHPLGKQFYTTLRYNESHSFATASTAGFATSYRFNLNSLYDPNETGLGHQPRGYDQLMALYNKYCVVAAKISVTIVPDSTIPSCVGIKLLDGAQAPQTDRKAYIENGDSTWKYMTTANGGNNRVTLVKNVNIKKFHGLKSIVGEDDFTFTSTQEPNNDNMVCADIWVAPLSSADTHGRMIADVLIEYKVVFLEPKELPIS